jgi:hypothetical protein
MLLCLSQELVTRKIVVLLNIDNKQNPADALTKHIEPKATFRNYMARLYKTRLPSSASATPPLWHTQPRTLTGAAQVSTRLLGGGRWMASCGGEEPTSGHFKEKMPA